MSDVAVLPDGVADLVPAYLGRQRWYAGSAEPDPDSVRVVDADELAVRGGGQHGMLGALAEAEGALYQLLIGERPGGEPADFLNGHEPAVLGMVGAAYYYDSTLDPELSLVLLSVGTGVDDD